MIDVIMAFLAAVGVTGVVLNRTQGMGLSGMEGLTAMLTNLVPGGLPCGITCVLITQVLAALLVWKGVALYYIHWVFRNEYDASKKASQAIEKANMLPLSPFMKRKLRRGIARQFCLVLQARHNERMKREGLM